MGNLDGVAMSGDAGAYRESLELVALLCVC